MTHRCLAPSRSTHCVGDLHVIHGSCGSVLERAHLAARVHLSIDLGWWLGEQ